MSDDDADDQPADQNAVPGGSPQGPVTKQRGAVAFDDLPEPEFAGLYAIDELSVDGDNPNEMTDKTFGLLVDRMRKNGWLGGPIITNLEGVIADGEHRWRAARDIGLEEVPVRMYDVDEPSRRLWREELNKIHGQHDPTRDALEYDYLLDHGKTDEVLELTGAIGEDLDDLLASIRVQHKTPIQYDYGGDPNIFYMDCVEGMREHLDDDSVDMVFTSPPYNVNTNEGYRWYKEQAETVNYDDDMDPDEFNALLRDTFAELARVVKPSGHIFVNFMNDFRGGVIASPTNWLVDLVPVPLRSYIVWNKGSSGAVHGTMVGPGRFVMNWEPILDFSEDPAPLNGRGNFSVWDVPASNQEFDHDTGAHPAPFPVDLVKRAIEPCTDDGDLILDPFMGSGTTAVAAIETERNYVGFELDDAGAYKPIIERRIKDAHRRMNAASTREEAAEMREADEQEVEADD